MGGGWVGGGMSKSHIAGSNQIQQDIFSTNNNYVM